MRGLVDVIHGDARDVVATLPARRFDAAICDPPYGVGVTKNHAGARWDTRRDNAAWDPDFWRDVRRTLKPGASLAAFGHPRTYHRMVSAIEDAGFWIVDTLAWIHGQGHAAGNRWLDVELARQGHPNPDEYAGVGTMLRPSLELVVLGRNSRKSLSTAIMDDGVGGLNIDATRIPTDDNRVRTPGQASPDAVWRIEGRTETSRPHAGGRHPGNVVLEHHPDCGDATCVDGCPVELVRQQGQATRGRGEDASRFHTVLHHPRTPAQGRPAGSIAPKPDGVIGWLADLLTRPGDTVVDPFAGTGAVVEALARRGRHAVAIEREADLIPLIHERLASLDEGVAAQSPQKSPQ